MEEQQVEYVPYQTCPKCLGEGEVLNCDLNCSAYGKIPCDVCHGAKIIPMARVENDGKTTDRFITS